MARRLTQLGRRVPIPASPDAAVIETVDNPHRDADYVVRFTAPEFTCLCPITGQPDFAHFVIDYVPGKWLLESKSLKLYLASFRNHGAFQDRNSPAFARSPASPISRISSSITCRGNGCWNRNRSSFISRASAITAPS